MCSDQVVQICGIGPVKVCGIRHAGLLDWFTSKEKNNDTNNRHCIEEEKIKEITTSYAKFRSDINKEFDDEFIRAKTLEKYSWTACEDIFKKRGLYGEGRKCKLIKAEPDQKIEGTDWSSKEKFTTQYYKLTFEASGTIDHGPVERLEKQVQVSLKGEEVTKAQIEVRQLLTSPHSTPRNLTLELKEKCETVGGIISGEISTSAKESPSYAGGFAFLRRTASAECVGHFYTFKDAPKKVEELCKENEKKALGDDLLSVSCSTIDSNLSDAPISKYPDLKVEAKVTEYVSFKSNPEKYKAWECEQVARCAVAKEVTSEEDKALVESLATTCKASKELAIQSQLTTPSATDKRDSEINTNRSVKDTSSFVNESTTPSANNVSK